VVVHVPATNRVYVPMLAAALSDALAKSTAAEPAPSQLRRGVVAERLAALAQRAGIDPELALELSLR